MNQKLIKRALMLRQISLALFFSVFTLAFAHAEVFEVVTPQEENVVTIKITESELSVQYKEGEKTEVLTASPIDSKRIYTSATGVQVARVKSKEGKFKLKGLTEQITFKVKGDLAKLKVVINGDEDRPLKIKSKGDQLKVYQSLKGTKTQLGRVKMSTPGKVKVIDASQTERYLSQAAQLSSAYGLLLDERIAPQYKYILMAEILLRQSTSPKK